uniref:SERPIN domain-containing protein n=1 Tax=Trichuris muris TaxID=70415 RepID=A0A5S6QGP2_TRIMR
MTPKTTKFVVAVKRLRYVRGKLVNRTEFRNAKELTACRCSQRGRGLRPYLPRSLSNLNLRQGISAMEPSESVAHFSWSLYQTQTTDNVVFSPVSIVLALSMVYLGSEGNTKQQMKMVMFDDGENGNFEKTAHLLMSAVGSMNSEFAKIVWHVANRLYVADSYDLLDSYTASLKSMLSSEIEKLNFTEKAMACKQINSWVSERTDGKINRIVDDLDERTRLIIVNAIYFKGAWDTVFRADKTVDDNFFVSEGHAVLISMMKSHGTDYFYHENSECQVLGLPYTSTNLRMYIVLPKLRFGLHQLEKTLSGKKLLELFKEARMEDVRVQMPKFKLEKEMHLENALKSLGMTDVFDQFKANLSSITHTERLYVSEALHKTFVDVNEEGTEAAGVTVVKVIPMSAVIAPRTYTFKADHPFIFAIVDMDSKLILFLGRFSGN